jgi:hypothetical protein
VELSGRSCSWQGVGRRQVLLLRVVVEVPELVWKREKECEGRVCRAQCGAASESWRG